MTPERKSEYNKRWRAKNREYDLKRQKERYAQVRFQAVEAARKRKAYFVELKGGRCMDCDEIFPLCCYDFDHRNPEEKEFCIGSGLGKTFEEILRELEKCDLVCSNCHRIRTSKRKAERWTA